MQKTPMPSDAELTFYSCLTMALWLTIIPPTSSASEPDIAPFPQAEEGYERKVIRLVEQPNEQDSRLELLVGRHLETDCNRHTLDGQITQETLTGWGYVYYRVESSGTVASTMMACPPDAPKRMQFVRIQETDPLRQYNSRMPVMVYVPEGLEVYYRIWSAGAVLGPAKRE